MGSARQTGEQDVPRRREDANQARKMTNRSSGRAQTDEGAPATSSSPANGPPQVSVDRPRLRLMTEQASVDAVRIGGLPQTRQPALHASPASLADNEATNCPDTAAPVKRWET
jgi:hypothetical protein